MVQDGEQATEAERKGAKGCDRLDSSFFFEGKRRGKVTKAEFVLGLSLIDR
jgi:hypothetical protein